MNAKKILILSSSHLCRNPRVLKEAAALGAAGHDVTVLTLSTVEAFERMDAELAASQPFRRVTLDYTARRPQARWENFRQRAATWGARKMLRWLRWETAQALGPARALLRRALATPADLTIAHTEIPLWAAAALIRAGRAVAVDMEDWYSRDLLPEDRRTRPLKLLARAEKFALQHTRYVSTTSQSLADALAAAYEGSPPVVLRNVFPLQARTRLDRKTGDEPPAFVWFSQTIGRGRGLELFFEAWIRLTRPSRVTLIGGGGTAYREALLRPLPAGRQAFVSFLPFLAPTALADKLTEYDIGLALEETAPANRNLTIGNKIFQYLNAGLAVAATATAGQSEVLRAAPDAGLLVATPEPAVFARQLDDLLAEPARLRAMQAAARRAAEQQFCWERETPRLLAAVGQALAVGTSEPLKNFPAP
ncbi:MAG TPA: glycosyltransferase [Opitutaceae bacterium]|nr:glycosyltransferase [Opitutaceae bacterium]